MIVGMLGIPHLRGAMRGGERERGSGGALPRSLFVFCVLCFVCGFSDGEAAFSLAGTSGLINIPVAEVVGDGEMVVGAGYVRGNYKHFDGRRYPIVPLCVALGYLPGLEFSARLTVIRGCPPQAQGLGDYKDGMASVHYRIFPGGSRVPAVAVGARDVYGFALFNALYGVASREIRVPRLRRLGGHLGLGVDWLGGRYGVTDAGKDTETFPVHRPLLGIFGGLDAQFSEHVTLMAEYDTKKVNAGVRMHLFSHLGVDLLLMGMKALGGGLYWSFDL